MVLPKGARNNIYGQDNQGQFVAGPPIQERIHANLDKLWQKIDRSGGPDACWLWQTASTRSYVYGYFYGRRATHVVWELTNGPVPDRLWVLHRCDNTLCCNPKHLFLGDQTANMEDMRKKGRAKGGPPGGSRNPNAKLTAEDALAIFHHTGRVMDIAEEFGVHRGTIQSIQQGRTWKAVTHG